MTIRRRGWVTAGALWALALTGAGTAGADPQEPPPPPAPAGLLDQLTGMGTMLGQTGSPPAGPFGLPDLSTLGPGLLLAQNPTPAGPDQPTRAALPVLSAFNPDYLIPLNLAPAAPGAGELAPGLGPDADSPGTGRIAFLRRLHEMYAAGQLDGALLGQRPPEPDTQIVPPVPPAG